MNENRYKKSHMQEAKDALTARWLAIGEEKLSIRQQYGHGIAALDLLAPLNKELDQIIDRMYPARP